MISPFDDLQQVLQQRRQSSQKLFADTRAQNVAMTRSPEEFAGAGLGNLFGTLGVNLIDKFRNPKGQSPEDALLEQRSRDQKGLFTDLSTQHANVSTPDGGMRTQSTPRDEVEQLQIRANKFREYAQAYGDPEAFKTAELFNQQAQAIQQQRAEQAKAEAGIQGSADFLKSRGAPDSLIAGVRGGTIATKDAVAFMAEKDPKIATVGLGRFVLPDGTEVSGGFTKDEKGNATVKVFDDEGNFVQAPAGTMPVQRQDGTTITFSDKDKFTNMMQLSSSYASETKDLRARTDELENLTVSLGTGIPNDTQAAMARIFGNKTRSNAELEMWANIGSLDERIVNSINAFIKGEHGKDQMSTIEDLVADMAVQTAQQWNRVNDTFSKRAEVGEIDPALVTRTDHAFTNYFTMSKEELKERFSGEAGKQAIANMSPLEIKILERSLSAMGTKR